MGVEDVGKLHRGGLSGRANGRELVTAQVEERRQHRHEVRLSVAADGLGDGTEEVAGSLLRRLIRLRVEPSAELLQDAISLKGANARLLRDKRARRGVTSQYISLWNPAAGTSVHALSGSCRFPEKMCSVGSRLLDSLGDGDRLLRRGSGKERLKRCGCHGGRGSCGEGEPLLWLCFGGLLSGRHVRRRAGATDRRERREGSLQREALTTVRGGAAVPGCRRRRKMDRGAQFLNACSTRWVVSAPSAC